MSTAVLVAHVQPVLHGQAVMASSLVERAAGWTRARLLVVNAAYASERDSLVTFSFRKLALTLRYLTAAAVAARRARAGFVIVTPSFFPGPFLKDAVVISLLRLLTGARIVAWVHMDPARLELDTRPWLYRRFARFAVGRVDSWVATAPTLADRWPSFIPGARRHAITNGIAAPPEDGIVRRPVSSPRIRVCFLSSLDDAKGWTDLLEAADEICASRADVEFVFYGDVGIDWTREDVARRFAACRFHERISWHGAVRGAEKWRALATSDLFCFPSRTEQFPLAVLEAMACGLAIVATRVGAIDVAVVERRGGWLIDPGSPADLRSALADALEDRARLERYGRFNAERQRSEFSIARFGADWERFLVARAAST